MKWKNVKLGMDLRRHLDGMVLSDASLEPWRERRPNETFSRLAETPDVGMCQFKAIDVARSEIVKNILLDLEKYEKEEDKSLKLSFNSASIVDLSGYTG